MKTIDMQVPTFVNVVASSCINTLWRFFLFSFDQRMRKSTHPEGSGYEIATHQARHDLHGTILSHTTLRHAYDTF